MKCTRAFHFLVRQALRAERLVLSPWSLWSNQCKKHHYITRFDTRLLNLTVKKKKKCMGHDFPYDMKCGQEFPTGSTKENIHVEKEAPIMSFLLSVGIAFAIHLTRSPRKRTQCPWSRQAMICSNKSLLLGGGADLEEMVRQFHPWHSRPRVLKLLAGAPAMLETFHVSIGQLFRPGGVEETRVINGKCHKCLCSSEFRASPAWAPCTCFVRETHSENTNTLNNYPKINHWAWIS